MKFLKEVLIIALLISLYQVKAQPIGPITTPITAYLPSEVPDLVDYTLMDTTVPVEPDYPNDHYIKGACNYIDLGGGCKLEFEYYYRTAGNIYNDLYIQSFSVKGDSCNIFDPPSENEYHAIIDLIAAYIISNCNPWGDSIPPCGTGMYSFYRIGHPTCAAKLHWVYDSGNDWFFYSVTPCQLNSQTDICRKQYTYCWKYENGIKVLYQDGILPYYTSFTCSPFLEGFPNITCIPVCE